MLFPQETRKVLHARDCTSEFLFGGMGAQVCRVYNGKRTWESKPRKFDVETFILCLGVLQIETLEMNDVFGKILLAAIKGGCSLDFMSPMLKNCIIYVSRNLLGSSEPSALVSKVDGH
jgi:hypothetical protein